jgi:hypothetical protein
MIVGVEEGTVAVGRGARAVCLSKYEATRVFTPSVRSTSAESRVGTAAFPQAESRKARIKKSDICRTNFIQTSRFGYAHLVFWAREDKYNANLGGSKKISSLVVP